MARQGRGSRGKFIGLRLNLDGTYDVYVRDDFRRIQEAWNQQDILRGEFEFAKYNFEEAGTFTINHCMPFTPCDFIITGLIGDLTTATINYNTVTDETMEITVDGAGCVRMLVGNIRERDIR